MQRRLHPLQSTPWPRFDRGQVPLAGRLLQSLGLFLILWLAIAVPGNAQVYDVAWGEVSIPSEISCGRVVEASVTATNTGSTAWTAADGVRLGLFGGDPFRANWRIQMDPSARIEPGDSYTFTWDMTPPIEAGQYTTDWQMIQEGGVRWFGDRRERVVTTTCELPSLAQREDAVRSIYEQLSLELQDTGQPLWLHISDFEHLTPEELDDRLLFSVVSPMEGRGIQLTGSVFEFGNPDQTPPSLQAAYVDQVDPGWRSDSSIPPPVDVELEGWTLQQAIDFYHSVVLAESGYRIAAVSSYEVTAVLDGETLSYRAMALWNPEFDRPGIADLKVRIEQWYRLSFEPADSADGSENEKAQLASSRDDDVSAPSKAIPPSGGCGEWSYSRSAGIEGAAAYGAYVAPEQFVSLIAEDPLVITTFCQGFYDATCTCNRSCEANTVVSSPHLWTKGCFDTVDPKIDPDQDGVFTSSHLGSRPEVNNPQDFIEQDSKTAGVLQDSYGTVGVGFRWTMCFAGWCGFDFSFGGQVKVNEAVNLTFALKWPSTSDTINKVPTIEPRQANLLCNKCVKLHDDITFRITLPEGEVATATLKDYRGETLGDFTTIGSGDLELSQFGFERGLAAGWPFSIALTSTEQNLDCNEEQDFTPPESGEEVIVELSCCEASTSASPDGGTCGGAGDHTVEVDVTWEDFVGGPAPPSNSSEILLRPSDENGLPLEPIERPTSPASPTAVFPNAVPAGGSVLAEFTSSPDGGICFFNGTGAVPEVNAPVSLEATCITQPGDWCQVFPERCGTTGTGSGCGILTTVQILWVTYSGVSCTTVPVPDPPGAIRTVCTPYEYNDIYIYRNSQWYCPELGPESDAAPDRYFEPHVLIRLTDDLEYSQYLPLVGTARHDSEDITDLTVWIDGVEVAPVSLVLNEQDPYTCSEFEPEGCNADSWFEAVVDISSFPPGPHTVTVAAETFGGITGIDEKVYVFGDDGGGGTTGGDDDAAPTGETIPGAFTCGATDTATVTFENTGTTIWTAADGYELRAVGGSDPLATPLVQAIPAASDPVEPGDAVTFTLQMQAPSTAGGQWTDWSMAKSGSLFGQELVRSVSVTCLTDESMVVSDSLPTSAIPGQSATVSLEFENTGTAPWRASEGYALGAVGGSDPFTSTTTIAIPSTNDPVLPGDRVTFQIPMTAPSPASTTSYTTDWRLQRQGTPFGETFSKSIEVTVGGGSTGTDNASVVVSHDLPIAMECGEQRAVHVEVRNTGDTTWTAADGYKLGAVGNSDPFRADTRILLAAGEQIAPQQSKSFTFDLTAPAEAGSYFSDWRMVRDGAGGEWFGEVAQRSINVSCSTGGGGTDASILVSNTLPSSLQCGEQRLVRIRYLNAGTSTWSAANGHRLQARGGSDPFHGPTVAMSSGVSVERDGEYEFAFTLTAPSTAGTYTTDWIMGREGAGEFGAFVSRSVDVTCGGGSSGDDATLQWAVLPGGACGTTKTARILLTNSGTTTWTPSTHQLGAIGGSDPFHGSVVSLPTSVSPGEEIELQFSMSLPSTPGTYTSDWRMEAIGGDAFGDPVDVVVDVFCVP